MCVWAINAIHITATFSLICGKYISKNELPRLHVTLVTLTQGYISESVIFCSRHSRVIIFFVPNARFMSMVSVLFILSGMLSEILCQLFLHE